MSDDKKRHDQDHEANKIPETNPLKEKASASLTGEEEKKARSIRDIAIDMAKPFNVRNPFAHTKEEIRSGNVEKPEAENTEPVSDLPSKETATVAADPTADLKPADATLSDSAPEETKAAEETDDTPAEPAAETDEIPDDLDPEEAKRLDREERERLADLELEEAMFAAGVDPAVSTCEELRQLANELENGKSPMFRKDEVCVQRKPALQLIRGLTALCDAQQGDGFEDELFDALASSDHEDEADFKPMYRVKNRAKSIIDDAMRQADVIVNDARVLSNRLLYDTESKIQSKYDEADSEIEARMTTTKEESTKRLTEARDELTASRKQSVEILNLYMNKAEDDYQGYWERAEQTLFASMLKSESVLGKACDIYERELKVIREDLETIEEIMEQLARSRPKQ